MSKEGIGQLMDISWKINDLINPLLRGHGPLTPIRRLCIRVIYVSINYICTAQLRGDIAMSVK